jgi:hypothetical protein
MDEFCMVLYNELTTTVGRDDGVQVAFDESTGMGYK